MFGSGYIPDGLVAEYNRNDTLICVILAPA